MRQYCEQLSPERAKHVTLEECLYALQKAERHLLELHKMGLEDVDAEFVAAIAPQIAWVESELAKEQGK